MAQKLLLQHLHTWTHVCTKPVSRKSADFCLYFCLRLMLVNWSGACCALWRLLWALVHWLISGIIHGLLHYWHCCHVCISSEAFITRVCSCYISLYLLRKGHWFSFLGMLFYRLHCQAGADVVALWLICGRPENVTFMVQTMVISNQLQMFPVLPAKLFCTVML